MSGVSTARPLRRNLLAVCLCFLAFAFAIEAKWAWYGPQGGPVSDVSAAKARPAEVPDVVVHGVPAPDLVNLQIPYALLATFASRHPFCIRHLSFHHIGNAVRSCVHSRRGDRRFRRQGHRSYIDPARQRKAGCDSDFYGRRQL